MKDVTIKKATPKEIDFVFSFLEEAALWLKSKNIDYWQNWISPQKIYVDWIKQGFKNNEFYFSYMDKLIIGCFRLQWQDEMFWGNMNDQAGYIHSFTTLRNQANLGLGKRIIKTIEIYCREKSKDFLRLDCGRHIDGLRNYYESIGFKNVGETTVNGEHIILYEKALKEEMINDRKMPL